MRNCSQGNIEERKQKMRIPITLSLALILKILVVHSNPCRWLNDGVDCVIQCFDEEGGSSFSISGFVETVYNEVSF